MTPQQTILYQRWLSDYKTPLTYLRGVLGGMCRAALARGHGWEDLEQCGHIGLMEAARRFDPAKAGPDQDKAFSTYAGWYILRELSSLIRKKQLPTVSANLDKLCDKNEFLEDLHKKHGRVTIAAGISLLELEDKRAARIIKRHYGIGCNQTSVSDVARKERVSRTRIYQIHIHAIRRLRELAA